jgi:hypothetical protein
MIVFESFLTFYHNDQQKKHQSCGATKYYFTKIRFNKDNFSAFQ